MAQFDVYKNSNPDTSETIPYLLDVQADLLEPLSTHLVVPLVRASEAGRILSKLNVRTKIENIDVILSVPELAGVPVQILREKVGNLANLRSDIIAAIDFLTTGS